MTTPAFTVGRYRDPDTGRERWAVHAAPSGVWYFAKRSGRISASALCHRLRREASESDPPAQALGALADDVLRELRRP